MDLASLSADPRDHSTRDNPVTAIPLSQRVVRDRLTGGGRRWSSISVHEGQALRVGTIREGLGPSRSEHTRSASAYHCYCLNCVNGAL